MIGETELSEEHPAATDATPIPAAAPDPAEVLPPPTPAVEPPVPPAPPTPAEADAVPPETPPFTPHTDEPGTLSIVEPNSAEKKPAEPETPPAAAPEEIKYEFTAPEGFELPAERTEPLTKWFGEHKVPQEAAQSLLDMHFAAMQEYRDGQLTEQHRFWADTRRQWREEIMADPILGGAAFETNKNAAIAALKLFVPAERREALDTALRVTGMADHPEFFRLWVSVARRFAEPAPPPPNPAPVANGAGRPPRTPGGRASIYQYPRGQRGG